MRSRSALPTAFAMAAMAAGGLFATVSPAAALTDTTMVDARRDAHRALDITRVEVSHSVRAVRVVVSVRDYAGMDSGARVATALGVHFDTAGDRKPEHLIKIDGMHTAAGSTRDWNRLRPNGMDPWGDWIDCVPSDWERPFIRPRPAENKVVFNAPRNCLRNPSSLRVAVQSYKPYRVDATPDWAVGWRRYSQRVTLN
jgi:hypothetical protein